MKSLNAANQVNQPQGTHPKGKKRKRLWEISNDLFCSICGTCLDLDEQRTILKKLHIDHKTMTDHEIHAFMVHNLYSENKLSRRLDSHLNAKYSYEISRLGEHHEEQFMATWQEHVKSGDICALYWVAVTHRGLSEKALHRVFSDVHMMSHLNGGKTRQEKKEYDRLLRANSELSAKLQQEKKLRKKLNIELAILEKTCRNLENRIQSLPHSAAAEHRDLTQANSTIERLVQENQELKVALTQVQESLPASLELAENLKKEKTNLKSELWLQKEINIQLYREVESLINNCRCDNCVCSQAEYCTDLCEKRVLVVGGLTKLRSFYRDLVKNLGGNFEYHDGYLHSGERELEALIKKSDIILCPIDCNSHGACSCVKKICSRVNKPYQMLPSSSLSSISQALAATGKPDNS